MVLTGCGSKNNAKKFADKLKANGFGSVEVTSDKEKKGSKTVLVAYDAHVSVNTDADPAACDVELENDASKSSLANYFDVDDVRDANGRDHDVENDKSWPDNPSLSVLRAELSEHGIDC
ncbi:hypothetical protein [Frankia nepalensis]|nr:hypothetical protein [Frankia nepalensis]